MTSKYSLTRRQFGKLSTAALLLGPAAGWPGLSLASNKTGVPLHGLSAFGELKYPPDYTHFSYVNPEAPKGGMFNFGISTWGYNQNPQTFDTLNTFVLKGNAPPRMELCYDSLMVRAYDEPSAIYGMAADSVEISEDRNTYTFIMRPEATWHDGTPITARDVAFTYLLLKEHGHPELALNLTNLESAAAPDGATLILRFNGKQSDRSILTIALMPILSMAYYSKVEFTKTSLDAPLGSGPYRVKRLNQGTFIEYERVEDYWARDMGFARGQNNFDVLRVEFYSERLAAFEAFKKGEINFREEFTSKSWATAYDFPAMEDGRARKQLFDAEKVPSFQAWAINKRRKKFADSRTIQAIDHCFDFAWTNENLFYGSYVRGFSFFQNSDFAATGKPEGEELALLESLKGKVDASVFEEAPVPPTSDGSGRDRNLLRKANQLFKEAGWVRKGSQLVDQEGNPFELEFLIRSPTFERILGKFISNLKSLGVVASIRLVDPAQYQKRLDTYDFDISGMARRFSATPTGETLKQAFGSEYANREGNLNFAGIENPAVDALIAKIDGAKSRADLVIVMRALDRVLRSTHSWIPNWSSANHRIAYWDMFGFPAKKPDYAFFVETYWWFDKEKAKAIGKA